MQKWAIIVFSPVSGGKQFASKEGYCDPGQTKKAPWRGKCYS